jgi:predicted phage terminase large subunit-like protein
LTRLDNKQTGCIILIMQRLHEADLAGVWLDKGAWYHLNLPAIAEREESIPIGGGRCHVRRAGDVLHAEREPREVLDQIKLDLGDYAFAAQYQQRPAPLGGGLIRLEWFKRYEGQVTPQPGDYIVLSCDTAYTVTDTADWTVITIWLVRPWNGVTMYILLDVFRRKLEFPAVESAILRLRQQWNACVIIVESVGAGIPLYQSLKAKLPLEVTCATPKDDKATRMMAETPAIERGRVWLPKEAPWLDAFERELVSFPNGRHDDQVDSLWLFLIAARHDFRGAPKWRSLAAA